MNADLFIQKFDRFLDAPDAVAKLRELVLELAAAGRLIPDALERPVAKDTKSMGAIVELVMGQAPAGDDCNTDGRGTVFVKVGEFGPLYPRIEEWTTNPLKFAKSGDVLVCVVGATVGKLNLAIDCAIGRSVAAIRPSAVIDTKFLYYSLAPYTIRLRKNSRGSAQGVIGKSDLNAIRLWVPDLAVQKRIVAKVDELMALCDRLESQLTEQSGRQAALARAALERFAVNPSPAELDLLFHPAVALPPVDLRKSILALAVQGKLVPQDPADEPAEECLPRFGLKSSAAPCNESESENDLIPPTWTRVRFEDVALVTGGVTLGRKLGDRKTVTLPYLRVANVKRGEIDISVIKEVTIAEGEIERYALRENDLLMTEGGDWDKVGRAAIWRTEIPVCLHQNHVFRARMRSVELTPFWFERYFNSPVGRRYFESASKQTTNLASINMRQVRSCPIPLPPIAEQRRIVAKVDELMAIVDRLEAHQIAARTAASALLDTAVAELIAAPKPSAPVAAPKSNIIPFSRPQIRAALAAEIIDRIGGQPNFGRVKLQKILYLAQHAFGLDELEADYHRDAAGPYDKELMREVDGTLRDRTWFAAAKNPDGGYTYHRLTDAGRHHECFEKLWPQQGPAIRALIDSMATWKTERCERLATVYGAWNDLIIARRPVTDDAILHEILNNWHPDKNKIPEAKWRETLAYLRTHGPTPSGYGQPTRSESENQAELFLPN